MLSKKWRHHQISHSFIASLECWTGDNCISGDNPTKTCVKSVNFKKAHRNGAEIFPNWKEGTSWECEWFQAYLGMHATWGGNRPHAACPSPLIKESERAVHPSTKIPPMLSYSILHVPGRDLFTDDTLSRALVSPPSRKLSNHPMTWCVVNTDNTLNLYPHPLSQTVHVWQNLPIPLL